MATFVGKISADGRLRVDGTAQQLRSISGPRTGVGELQAFGAVEQPGAGIGQTGRNLSSRLVSTKPSSQRVI